eukprot:3255103-Amphidinium_carterae.1
MDDKAGALQQFPPDSVTECKQVSERTELKIFLLKLGSSTKYKASLACVGLFFTGLEMRRWDRTVFKHRQSVLCSVLSILQIVWRAYEQ